MKKRIRKAYYVVFNLSIARTYNMTSVTVQLFRQSLIDSRVLTALVLFVSGGALAVPVLGIQNPYTVILPLAVFVAGLVGLYHHFRTPELFEIRVTVAVPETLVYTLWFVVLSLVILLYTLNGFARNLSVNLLLLCLYVLVISTILITDRPRRVLALLLATGLVHRTLIYFVNPLPYGADQHYHYGNAHFIAQTGTLEPLHNMKELIAPFYHITGAVGTLIMNIPIRQGTIFLLLIVSITVVTTLLVYHLTSSLWNQQAGLFAGVLYLAGDQTTGDVLTIGTTEFGLLWFVIVLYGLIWYFRTQSKRYLTVFLVALFALNFTHHGSMFVITFTIVTVCICGLLLVGYSARLINVSLLSVLALFFNWMSSNLAGGEESFLGWIVISLLNNIEQLWMAEEIRVTPEEFGFLPDSLMAGSGYLDVLGLGFLFLFAVFGVLYWTAVRQDYTREFVVLIGSVICFLLALLLVGSVLGINLVVPSRWFKHLYFLLAIPAGVGFLGLLGLLPTSERNPSTVLVCVLILMVPYLVLMGGSFSGSIDDPIFDDAPAAERLSYTDEEIATVEFPMRYATDETVVVGDQFAFSALRWDETVVSTQQRRMTIDVDNNIIFTPGQTTMVINRAHIYSGHAKFNIWSDEFGSGPPPAVRGEAPLNPSVFEGYVKVYHAEGGYCHDTSCGIYLNDP